MNSNSSLLFIFFLIYSLFLPNSLRFLSYCLAFTPGIYFTFQNSPKICPNPINNPGDPSFPSQPSQPPAADPSQQWDSDDEAVAQPYGQQPYAAPQWDDEVTPAVQPYEPPSWDEQDSVSDWANETAAPAQPNWEDDGVECWGEEGSQVGQKQDADTNWASGTAQTWEAESEPPQWEELRSVRVTRLIVVVL